MISLAFIAGSLQGHWWGFISQNYVDPSSFLLMFSLLLKELIFYFYLSDKINAHIIKAASSELVSSSIPSWKILTAHAQPFRGAKDLAFCLKVPLDSLLVRASSGGSGETAQMRRLAWTFAARIGHKYQIRLTWPINQRIKCFALSEIEDWKIALCCWVYKIIDKLPAKPCALNRMILDHSKKKPVCTY